MSFVRDCYSFQLFLNGSTTSRNVSATFNGNWIITNFTTTTYKYPITMIQHSIHLNMEWKLFNLTIGLWTMHSFMIPPAPIQWNVINLNRQCLVSRKRNRGQRARRFSCHLLDTSAISDSVQSDTLESGNEMNPLSTCESGPSDIWLITIHFRSVMDRFGRLSLCLFTDRPWMIKVISWRIRSNAFSLIYE